VGWRVRLLLRRVRRPRLRKAADVAKGSSAKGNSKGSGASRVVRVLREPVLKVHGCRARKVLHAKGRVIVSVADPVVIGRAAIGPEEIVPEATEGRVPVVIAVMIEGRVPVAAGRASMGLRWISSWRS
jgi:hypothetical protein